MAEKCTGVEFHHFKDVTTSDAKSEVEKLFPEQTVYHASGGGDNPKKVLVASAD